MQELLSVGKPYNLKVVSIYGGVSYDAQIKVLQAGMILQNDCKGVII
jgi:hypothetical protein